MLPPALADQWGDSNRVNTVWRGRRLTIFGKLLYRRGGKLARVAVESVRDRSVPSIDIESILDSDFTSGLDPVEYLEKLHEGQLG